MVPRLSNHTVQLLLDRATEAETMAASACLATRFRALATRRAAVSDAPVVKQPGDLASLSGRYDELNIFGSKTGATAHVEQGAPFPAAPRGFTWQLARARSE